MIRKLKSLLKKNDHEYNAKMPHLRTSPKRSLKIVITYIHILDDGDVVVHSAVTPCYYRMLCALSRIVSFEACCQWALLIVYKSLHTTLLFKFTVPSFCQGVGIKKILIYLSHVGTFRIKVTLQIECSICPPSLHYI